MELRLECPKARYNAQMFIDCTDGGLCGHQYFKRCKGWAVQTEGAKKCPLRREKDGKND